MGYGSGINIVGLENRLEFQSALKLIFLWQMLDFPHHFTVSAFTTSMVVSKVLPNAQPLVFMSLRAMTARVRCRYWLRNMQIGYGNEVETFIDQSLIGIKDPDREILNLAMKAPLRTKGTYSRNLEIPSLSYMKRLNAASRQESHEEDIRDVPIVGGSEGDHYFAISLQKGEIARYH